MGRWGLGEEVEDKLLSSFLEKYPKSYHALQLRYKFHKASLERGRTERAGKFMEDLRKDAEAMGVGITLSNEPE